MKHDPLRPTAGPGDLLRPREAAASPDHAARAFEAALSRADARCEARPDLKDKAGAPPRPAATPKSAREAQREPARGLAREPQSHASPPASTAPRQEASRAFGDAPSRSNGGRAPAEPPPRRQDERSCAPTPRPACAPPPPERAGAALPPERACAVPSHGSSPGTVQARPNPACAAAPEPRSACQETVARAPAPNARPAPSAKAMPTPCSAASAPSSTAEAQHTVSRPEAKRTEPLEAGRARPSEPEAPEAPEDGDRDDTAELALLAPPGPVPALAPPALAGSAAVHGAATPTFAGPRQPSSEPTAGVSAAAGGARRIRPLGAALATTAQAGAVRAAAHPTELPASSTLALNTPTPGFDARPVPVFEASPAAGQTTSAETAQHHARVGLGLAVDPSQARVWQVELPMGPHADAVQLTVSRHFEANASARADAVWALSLPAHRHARAALDALKVRLQRRGLSVGQVEDDAGSEPPEPLPR